MNIPILGLIENMSYAVAHIAARSWICLARARANRWQRYRLDFWEPALDVKLNALVDEGKIEDYTARIR